MKIPARQVTRNLVLLPTSPGISGQETEIDHIAPATPFIAIMPKARGIYPWSEFTQLQLNIGIWQMPDDASYVDITLIKFRGFQIPADASSFNIGSEATGIQRFEFFTDQYLVPNVLGFLDPFPATIRFTSAAPALAYNTVAYSVAGSTPTLGGIPGAGGGAFSWPLTDDFAGFLVESDDDLQGGAGVYTLSVTLGSN